jgi:hypothetical protein
VAGARRPLQAGGLRSKTSSSQAAPAAPAVAGGGSATTGGSSTSSGGGSSSSSSKSGVWPSGDHNYHPGCPLCVEEQQQRQQALGPQPLPAANPPTSSRKSNIYTAWPVPYDDAFMWRRLLWQLLGELSPEAQAFYAVYLAMCPHATDPQ